MKKRVLIVDDEPSIVISLEYLLQREGYETAIAPDGEEALAALGERTHDLVVLDVMLPKMNGFEVCERIRADPRWRGTKILMLTARGRDAEVTRGLRLGADAYVTKPFSTKDLMAEVNQLLGVPR